MLNRKNHKTKKKMCLYKNKIGEKCCIEIKNKNIKIKKRKN